MCKYETRKESDSWWELISAIEYFNKNWIKLWLILSGSSLTRSCMDLVQKIKTYGLPYLSFIDCKPKPLGT